METLKDIGVGIKSAFTSSFLEVPKYEVEQKHQEYEERSYTDSVWVSTEVQAMQWKEATTKGFWRLFGYISGENENKKKIPMTAPVAVKVLPGAGPNCESTFTISFYVGKEFQEDPPKPTNPEVFIQRWEPMKVYARQFGGYASESDWIDQARSLGDHVPTDAKFIKDYYFTAGYDAPMKIFNRRNEIWFIKQETEPSS